MHQRQGIAYEGSSYRDDADDDDDDDDDADADADADDDDDDDEMMLTQGHPRGIRTL